MDRGGDPGEVGKIDGIEKGVPATVKKDIEVINREKIGEGLMVSVDTVEGRKSDFDDH